MQGEEGGDGNGERGGDMTDRELMQIALDALEWEWGGEPLGSKTWTAIEALRARLAQPEPKPVAWAIPRPDGLLLDIITPEEHESYEGEYTVPLYTAPPQREWVGLTDEEIELGNNESWVDKQAWESAVWWAEAKLREKNG